MARDITTFTQLFAELEKELLIDISKIGEEVKCVLKHYVQQNWYNRMGGIKQGSFSTDEVSFPEYERTMMVLESITCGKVEKIKDGYKIEIYFDIDKIIPQSQSGLFNAHMSVDGSDTWNGKSVPELLIYWMNYGQNSPIYAFPGSGFWEDTIEFLESDRYHINRMKELLRNKGFVIE